MASATLANVIERFPAGTSVGAYPISGEPLSKVPYAGVAPQGTATATATVAADGSLAFTGLADGTAYAAGAQVSGQWRWVGFRSSGGESSHFEVQANKGIAGGYAVAATYGLLANRPSVGTAGDQGIYFATDDNGGTLYQVQSAAWVLIAQRAVEKNYAEITTDVSGIVSTTYVDVAGLAITFTAGSRPVEVEFFSPKLLENTSGTVMTFQICSSDAATTYVEGVFTAPVANGQTAWSLKRVLRTLTAGTSYSMKLQVKVSSGSGFIGATAPKGPAFLSALER